MPKKKKCVHRGRIAKRQLCRTTFCKKVKRIVNIIIGDATKGYNMCAEDKSRCPFAQVPIPKVEVDRF